MSKQNTLKVYALNLDIPYGGGLAIVVAKSKKQSVDIANKKAPQADGIWKGAEKLPLYTKAKTPRVITCHSHIE